MVNSTLRTVAAALGMVATGWLVALLLPALSGETPRRHRIESASLVLAGCLVLLVSVRPWVARFPVTAVPGRDRLWMSALWVVAVAWWVWTLRLGPLSDDFVIRQWVIDRNWLPTTWPFARPLPMLAWGAVLAAGGDWAALHLLNVSLHALNVALVFRLGRTGFGIIGGAVAGVLFLFFPAHVEAVAWTAGVFDVAACAGILIVLNAWCSGLSAVHRAVVVSFGMGIALGSKESAVVLPVLLVLVDLTIRRGSWDIGRMVTALLALGGTVGYVAWRVTLSPAISGHLSQLPQSRYQVKELLVRPFGALVAPIRTDDGQFLLPTLSALAVLSILAVGLRSAWRSGALDPLVGMLSAGLRLGLVWPLVAVAPLLMQFYVSDTLEGSRYAYLASVGFSIFLGGTVASTGGIRRRVSLAAVSVLLGVWLTAALVERQIWTQAAVTRDSTLADVARLAEAHDCMTFELRRPPDSLRGAYVLREGAALAIREALAARTGSRACVAEWTGAGVRLVE